MQYNFNRWSAHETCVREVCAAFANRWPTWARSHNCPWFVERSCEDVQFLKNTVTGEESWVYGYDPETKQQLSQWKGPMSPRSKKGCQVRSKIKVMLLAFFDSEGIVHHEYVPDGQTINKEFYMEVLWHLCESFRWKWLEKWLDGDWLLHHDNVPAHTSHIVQQFLAIHGTAQLQQPTYSPDLAPCWLFPIPKA